MSGSFENIDVPPTLVSFAVTTDRISNIISPEFKKAGKNVYLIKPEYDENNLPKAESLKEVFSIVTKLMREGKVNACYTPTYGGIAEAVLKMAMGNMIGFKFEENISLEKIFGYSYGSFLFEAEGVIDGAELIGKTTDEKVIALGSESISLEKLCGIYEDKLEKIYSCNIKTDDKKVPVISYDKKSVFVAKEHAAKPSVLIPVFPGTNCEYDTAKAFMRAGAVPEIFVINNLTAANVSESVSEFAKKIKNSQMIFIPGGFSGGDEPDGSGKLITAFFRNTEISENVTELLDVRGGLMAGICNGFQALIKLGLVPFGKIIEADENCPTLTFNTISRHQSKIVRTRIASTKSPWLSKTNVGDIYSVPISHGEGRFLASDELISKLAENGQIITQYVDLDGNPTNDIQYNPNGSACAIEGIISPDGRVLGKMGHSERVGKNLYRNVEGSYEMGLFESAVEYFK